MHSGTLQLPNPVCRMQDGRAAQKKNPKFYLLCVVSGALREAVRREEYKKRHQHVWTESMK